MRRQARSTARLDQQGDHGLREQRQMMVDLLVPAARKLRLDGVVDLLQFAAYRGSVGR